MTLKCHTGTVVASVGDRFHRVEPSEDWTVSGFGKRFNEAVVMCSPDGGCPGWAKKFEETDGTVAFSGDTVAALMLEGQDGKPRDARGYILEF